MSPEQGQTSPATALSFSAAVTLSSGSKTGPGEGGPALRGLHDKGKIHTPKEEASNLLTEQTVKEKETQKN